MWLIYYVNLLGLKEFIKGGTLSGLIFLLEFWMYFLFGGTGFTIINCKTIQLFFIYLALKFTEEAIINWNILKFIFINKFKNSKIQKLNICNF